MSEWSGEKLNEVIHEARQLRQKFLADPHRPGYHFLVPEGTHGPVDPNAALYYKGRFHLSYIYQDRGLHYWGHASSLDLLHWRHHPPILAPGDGDEGIFSGGAFVDDDGKAVISYWRLGKPDGIAIAVSTDENLDRWTRLPANPVLPSTGWGFAAIPNPDGPGTIPVGTADPSAVWRRDGRYYMLTGNLLVLHEFGIKRQLPEHQGDTLYLFASDDLVRWTYLHPFYASRRDWTRHDEDDMCPDFFPLPASPDGGVDSGRHMILFISHNLGCQYYTGLYASDRFTPETHGRMTWVDNHFFAPESLRAPDGRRIMWAWVFDGRPGEARAASGWSGEMSLPRSLWLGPDNTLRMQPVRELERLRYNPRVLSGLALQAGRELALPLTGNSLELSVTFPPSAGRCGLKVLASLDGQEETLIAYDFSAGVLEVDTTRSSLAPTHKVLESAPLSLPPGEPLSLRVFLDKSFVEVFANDRQAIARRAYPTRRDSLGLSLFAANAATLPPVRAWDMMPSNPY